jgi:hypothetical protein
MQDYSTAEPARDFDLIPAGTLAFGILSIKGGGETPSKSSDAAFLDCEITICEGPFNRRKVFTRIGTKGSQAYTDMGRSAIRSILEVGRGASSVNAAGYRINEYSDLHGLKIAVEVKIEKGEGSYKDKNEIQAFLTPNTESATSKKFAKLLADAQGGYQRVAEAPKQGNAPAPWGAPSNPAAAAAQQTSQAAPASVKPAWLS